MRYSRKSNAFTMVEIIVVVVILSIAALMAVPLMSSAASLQIQSAADIITADLEYARSISITHGQNYTVEFDAANERYWIEDQNGDLITHPVKLGFNYVTDFKNDSRLSRVDITSVDFDGTNSIRFDYLGSPINGSGTPLTSGTIVLQAGDSTISIDISAMTGYINIQ